MHCCSYGFLLKTVPLFFRWQKGHRPRGANHRRKLSSRLFGIHDREEASSWRHPRHWPVRPQTAGRVCKVSGDNVDTQCSFQNKTVLAPWKTDKKPCWKLWRFDRLDAVLHTLVLCEVQHLAKMQLHFTICKCIQCYFKVMLKIALYANKCYLSLFRFFYASLHAATSISVAEWSQEK